MSNNPDLAAVAALIADPARAAMLTALMDDVALPAGELARLARVTPQTASTHLAKLVKGNLVSITRTGRHRYFRLRSKNIARTLESLAFIAPAAKISNLRDSLERKAIYRARTCYDHLAGELGVRLAQAMLDLDVIQYQDETYEITSNGRTWMDASGIDCDQLLGRRRIFARACHDWSERKPHIAGSLGAALLKHMFERKWIVRVRDSRAVKVTELGRAHLNTELGIDWK
jgi:DNA-binding transcriptional ArsR family regulator